MGDTKLQEPIPREKPVFRTTGVPVFGAVILRPYRRRVKPRGYEELLNLRRSVRRLRKPTGAEIGDMLWLTQGITRGNSPARRALPSPGGLHSVRILVLNYPGHKDDALLYAPEYHSLALVASGRAVRRSRVAFSKVLPLGDGSVFWFIGDVARITGKYRNPESLLWREAGVLTAGVYLAAAHLGLKCCALGMNGTAELSRFDSALANYAALGACAVGR